MYLIRSRTQLARARRKGAATIGNFDGIHRGHRAMLERAAAQQAAREDGLSVITFEPRPLDYFLGDKAPGRVLPFRDKCLRLSEAGVDQMLNLRFDQALAEMAPEDFVHEFLVEGLGLRYLLVGADFRYGRKRAGDVDSLHAAARRHGFVLDVMPTVVEGGERIASTGIREALEAGAMDRVTRLLGRPYTISGRVRRGRELGRSLGFPTANLEVPANLAARDGVWVARVVRGLDSVRDAVASLGTRPTVGGQQRLLEVHLLDFEGDLYHRHLEVELRHHLRDEARFPDTESLTEKMHEDLRRCREWIGRSPESHSAGRQADARSANPTNTQGVMQ